MRYGTSSEVGRLQEVLIKHARDAFVSQDNIDDQWRALNYTACPRFSEAVREYDRFIEYFASEGITIHFLPSDRRTGLDSIYPRDASIITPDGIVICGMGKKEREGESEAMSGYYKAMNMPVIGRIERPGKLEGGDIIWLDNKTIVVGCGYRTNDEGIRQLRKLLDRAVDIMTVPLPHWNGPEDVFHLMSIISPIDHDLAVVYSRLMPVPFREMLLERGMELIDVPDNEFETMACNILALAPRRCLMLSGNPITARKLREAEVEVMEFEGREISRKGMGGPTCLTRPLFREDRV